MKLTRDRLKQIIKEELEEMMGPMTLPQSVGDPGTQQAMGAAREEDRARIIEDALGDVETDLGDYEVSKDPKKRVMILNKFIGTLNGNGIQVEREEAEELLNSHALNVFGFQFP